MQESATSATPKIQEKKPPYNCAKHIREKLE